MAQKHQHTQQLLPQIKKKLEEGMTQKEVENTLGLTGYRPVHELLKRERRKAAKGVPKFRGRLKMEVELLRDFLQSTERM